MLKSFFRRYKIVRTAPGRRDYMNRKEEARKLAAERLTFFASEYARLDLINGTNNAPAMQYKRLSIRNQKSRWGSCSSKKNLNFNYRILDLPQELQDYVIVHELCHLKELNHKEAFWKLMELVVPRAREFHDKARKIRLT